MFCASRDSWERTNRLEFLVANFHLDQDAYIHYYSLLTLMGRSQEKDFLFLGISLKLKLKSNMFKNKGLVNFKTFSTTAVSTYIQRSRLQGCFSCDNLEFIFTSRNQIEVFSSCNEAEVAKNIQNSPWNVHQDCSSNTWHDVGE